MSNTVTTRPQIVIVGAGFAGLACARALGHANANITVIDRRNHNLFQPLLYQVATAALSPSDICEPIRRTLSPFANVKVVLGEVEGIDRVGKVVDVRDDAPSPLIFWSWRPARSTITSATTRGAITPPA
jgi:NADH:ubiquinone reductase (H+-translocating)